MHDTVADGAQIKPSKRAEPTPCLGDGRRQIGDGLPHISAVDQDFAVGGRAQARAHANSIDLAANTALESSASNTENLELQARRTGIED